jgi:hypothetical protein
MVEVAAVVLPPSPEVDWRKAIAKYLQLGTISDDKIKTRRLACRAKGYMIHNNELYRRSTSGILHRCIPHKVDKALLLDIHEGSVGIILHRGAWSGRLSDKAFIGQLRPATRHK